jgi:hypothetical protein
MRYVFVLLICIFSISSFAALENNLADEHSALIQSNSSSINKENRELPNSVTCLSNDNFWTLSDIFTVSYINILVFLFLYIFLQAILKLRNKITKTKDVLSPRDYKIAILFLFLLTAYITKAILNPNPEELRHLKRMEYLNCQYSNLLKDLYSQDFLRMIAEKSPGKYEKFTNQVKEKLFYNKLNNQQIKELLQNLVTSVMPEYISRASDKDLYELASIKLRLYKMLRNIKPEAVYFLEVYGDFPREFMKNASEANSIEIRKNAAEFRVKSIEIAHRANYESLIVIDNKKAEILLNKINIQLSEKHGDYVVYRSLHLMNDFNDSFTLEQYKISSVIIDFYELILEQGIEETGNTMRYLYSTLDSERVSTPLANLNVKSREVSISDKKNYSNIIFRSHAQDNYNIRNYDNRANAIHIDHRSYNGEYNLSSTYSLQAVDMIYRAREGDTIEKI